MIDPATPAPDSLGTSTPPRPSFAHASEAEMSRILDFYGVEWRYEPTTFPILWNLEGEVVESFSPDFYLPEFDMYLEMTTLKQSLVRKKNRKLRRLRELYPDIRIKLFYARDFRAMMLKYGRFGLAESLSGTSGQLVAGELLGSHASEPSTSEPLETRDLPALEMPAVAAPSRIAQHPRTAARRPPAPATARSSRPSGERAGRRRAARGGEPA